MLTGLNYDINELYQEAKKRWLKPVEVLYLLKNHEKCGFTNVPPHQPAGGSLFLFNRRIQRFFRKDGHNWRKKKDGRTVGEAHERLKVGNAEILNCYYAHGEENRSFQRRSYWMLDPEYEHVVLVHYRETKVGTSNSRPVKQLSPGSSYVFSQNHSSYAAQNPGTTSRFDDSCEPNQTFSSPGSLEVTSDVFIKNNEMNHLDETGAQAFHQLEELLIPHEFTSCQNQRVVYQQEKQIYDGMPDDSVRNYHELLDWDCHDKHGKSLSCTGVLESCKPSSVIKLPEQHTYEAYVNEMSQSSSGREMFANQENNHWIDPNSTYAKNSVFSIPPDPPYSSVETHGTNYGCDVTWFNQIQIQEPLGADSSLTVTPPLGSDSSLTVTLKQKFTIKAVSPEYCYTTENTKVIIVGSFICPPSDSTWACMFGDVEVPVQMIQDGVISCEAPSHLFGKVTLCITSGNKEPCSEVREFEFRNKTNSCTRCNSLEAGSVRSPEELLLLVRFAEMLLSASTTKDDSKESSSHLSTKQKTDDDSWSHIIDALLAGSGTSSSTMDWLLEELLKDKLQLWLSFRSHQSDEGTGCSLSKKEQGIIHMVSGLGFEWALNPIIDCSVNVNFRDINGWTALHWAARFGREKMVAALIAAGASAGALTDPTSEDPTGKTAASIAASNGHKGLAGYLSEVHLTSHLSSLTLEESEMSKDSFELEAELTVNRVSKENLTASEDQVSLQNSLDAVRNAVQAAARIQAAFREHSFKKRKEKEAAVAASYLDGYGINADCIDDNILMLAPMSNLSFRKLHHYNSAAVSIQKRYRGWKGRKDFLALRQKVVKIQAHVRGYQARKQYKLMIWAVGVLDKVVLRWRRKRVGLQNFRQERQSDEESDDEDFLKVFRKEKVNGLIEKALARVLSMVRSTGARRQYSRLLEMYHKAKAEHVSTSDETLLSTSVEDAFNMEDDEFFKLLAETLHPF